MPTRHLPGRTPRRLRNRATWLTSRAHARASGLLTAAFEADGGGLRSYHYRLLCILEESGVASQAELGRAAGIDRSDVTAALAELEPRGLVRRSPDPANKRRNIVTITDAGVASLLRLDGVIDRVQGQYLAPLSPEQRRQLLDLLSLVGEV